VSVDRRGGSSQFSTWPRSEGAQGECSG
jgi:hypothetical protein